MEANANTTAAQTFVTIDAWVRRYPDAFPRYLSRLTAADREYTLAVLRWLIATADFDAAADDIEVLRAGLRDTILEIQVEKIIP